MLIPFGTFFTVAVGLMLLLLAALVISELILRLGQFLLSTKNPNSPIKLERNYVLDLIKKIFYRDNIRQYKDLGWGVRSNSRPWRYWYYLSENYTWTDYDQGNDRMIKKYCLTEDKKSLESHPKYKKSFYIPYIFYTLLFFVGLDAVFYSLQKEFLVTISILLIVGISLCLKLTTNFLWNNIATTSENEARITKLEEDKKDV